MHSGASAWHSDSVSVRSGRRPPLGSRRRPTRSKSFREKFRGESERLLEQRLRWLECGSRAAANSADRGDPSPRGQQREVAPRFPVDPIPFQSERARLHRHLPAHSITWKSTSSASQIGTSIPMPGAIGSCSRRFATPFSGGGQTSRAFALASELERPKPANPQPGRTTAACQNGRFRPRFGRHSSRP